MNQWFRTMWLIAFFAFLQNPLLGESPVEAMPVREQGLWQTVTMVAIALAFFYFILWRPEQKRRKAMETQRASLKKGDRVNAMGILGTVVRVQDETVIVKMYDGAKIEFLKVAISDVISTGHDVEEEKGKS